MGSRLRYCLSAWMIAAFCLVFIGCSTTREENGVIIEQRRWWQIFSEADPGTDPEDSAREREEVPS